MAARSNFVIVNGPLSDASYFLKRTHSIAGKAGQHYYEADIHSRACILFAWSAVEGIVLHELRRLRKSGRKMQFPKSLLGKVQLLMSERQSPFDALKFERLRNYRHEIAHPPKTPTYTAPPPRWAQEHFDYCVELCRALYSKELAFSDRQPTGL